ncbi:MAG: hypothetical protein ABSG82_08085 [Sedimentisphaerales bacterium]|jgi:hypothetical protein
MSKTIIVGVALVCVMLAPVVIAAEGVVGEWEFKSQMPARTSTATMTITKNAEGKYSGTWSAQFGESTLSDITFENGKVKFVQTSNFGGQDMKTTYEGTVEGTKIKGKGQGQFGEFTFDGTLQGEAKTGADAIVGEWQINVNMPARENVEKLTITKNDDGTLAGKWAGQRGESVISNLKFEGGKLTFTRTMKFGGREMSSAFEGTVEGNTIKGVFKGDRGDREVTATRVGATKPEPNKPK